MKILLLPDKYNCGLKLNHVDLTINYDIPWNPNDYFHRIGRMVNFNPDPTVSIENKSAITFVAQDSFVVDYRKRISEISERHYLKDLETKFNFKANLLDAPASLNPAPKITPQDHIKRIKSLIKILTTEEKPRGELDLKNPGKSIRKRKQDSSVLVETLKDAVKKLSRNMKVDLSKIPALRDFKEGRYEYWIKKDLMKDSEAKGVIVPENLEERLQDPDRFDRRKRRLQAIRKKREEREKKKLQREQAIAKSVQQTQANDPKKKTKA
jgi:superfamily II DNA/RNA helicase